eukprot:403347710
MERISKSPITRQNNKTTLSPSRNSKVLTQKTEQSQLNFNNRPYSTKVLKQSKRKMMLASSFQNLRAVSYGLSDSLRERSYSFDLNQQKKLLKKRSTMIAQGIYESATLAQQSVQFVGQKATALHRNLNILSRYICGYPKIVYVPFLILSSAAYGFHSVKKTKSPHLTPDLAAQESPLTDFPTFKKWVASSAVEQIIEVVANKDVKREGVSYLERMFKNKQIHDSLIILLKGAVKDNRFVTESKKYGIDWIGHTITSQQVKGDLKDLMSATFVQDKRVVQTSTNLLKYFVMNAETKDLTKNIVAKVCLRGDVLQALGKQMENSSYNAVQSAQFQDQMNKTIKEVVFDVNNWAEVKQQLVYRPLADTLTFGLYSRIRGIETNQKELTNFALSE